jgi:hypothetical protein
MNWHIVHKKDNAEIRIYYDPATVSSGESLIKLFEAVPDVLKALRTLLSVLPEDDTLWEDPSQARQIEQARSEAESAIIKATGNEVSTR